VSANKKPVSGGQKALEVTKGSPLTGVFFDLSLASDIAQGIAKE